MTARPFTINVPQYKLDHIAAKLALSRPGYAPADDGNWSYGTDAKWLEELLVYWRDKYDWRRCEAALNKLPHFVAEVEGLDIHFIHVRAKLPNQKFPIILTHGWPGSVLEFLHVIKPLVEQGFDLVIPSLPGYAFSGRPNAIVGPRAVAALWCKLMTETLGYEKFFAQGGDWGSAVTSALGHDHGEFVAAIHLNLAIAPLSTDGDDKDTTEYRRELAAVQMMESAYMMEHATKPQTIGLALADSPIGFASWVCEKFNGWGDTGGDIESRFTKDQLLDNIMLYLVNDAVQSSLWMYRSIFSEERISERITVPTGIARYPAEFMPYPPRSAVERSFNLVDWQIMQSGGHFAAMEEPDAFALNVGGFFSHMRCPED